MRIYFNDSLCKKCPHHGPDPCAYKEAFYKGSPKARGRFKLIHKCQHYKNIFPRGRVVLVDLFHQELVTGKLWEFVTAHRKVPGVVVGCRGSKYRIELFEAVFLSVRKKGHPDASERKLFLHVTKTAKEIIPVGRVSDWCGEMHRVSAEKNHVYLS